MLEIHKAFYTLIRSVSLHFASRKATTINAVIAINRTVQVSSPWMDSTSELNHTLDSAAVIWDAGGW